MGFRVTSRSSDLEATGKFNTRSGMMPQGKAGLFGWLLSQVFDMLDLFPALTRFWFREERDLSLESLARARQLVWASFRLSSSSKYYQWKGVQHPS